MNYQNRITIDSEIMVGKPCIKGTRITVELIVKLLGQGWTYEELLHEYPHLKKDDIQAALLYANNVLENEMVLPLETVKA